MVQQKKIFFVQNLAEKIKDAKAVYLTDYKGLDVSQMSQLRKKIQEAGGQLEVVKNRLFKLALKKSEQVKDEDLELTGPTAILWANQDVISPLKALVEFAKENSLPTLKIGIFEEEIIGKEKMQELAEIPPRNQLETRLVGNIYAPLFGLYNALSWNRQKLIYALKNIADS